MSDYRRFVSYIYEYKYGKKEKNTGFAKVEARNGNLKISIQLENAQDGQGRLDAYGFVRKGEKLYGIPLGELTLAPHPSLRVLTSSENVAGSGYPLRSLAGLWLKGNQGENHITIWDDEPIARMDLEMEIKTSASPDPSAAEEAVETTIPAVPVVGEQQEKMPVSTVTKSSVEAMTSPSLAEEKQSVLSITESSSEAIVLPSSTEKIPSEEMQSVTSGPESSVEIIESSAPEKAMLGTAQSVLSVDEMSAKISPAVNAEPVDEPDLSAAYSEKLRSEPIPSVADDTEAGVKTASSIEGISAADTEPKLQPSVFSDAASTSDQAFPAAAEPKVISSETILPEQENSASAISNYSVWKTTLAEQVPNGGKNINGVRAQEAASMTVARPQCFKARQPQHTSNQYASENEKIWNSLSRTYPHLNPFPEEEVLDCVRISPRELHLFRRQGWNAPKNTFMLHGYYNFRHLIFGQFPDGGYFLGVPGYYSSQEQRVAASFGFPIFKDGRNSRNTGRLGYWCRPL